MLLDLAQLVVGEAVTLWNHHGVGPWWVPLIVLVPLALLLLWRLWMFTILPILRPNDPKELPYWIPCECKTSPVPSL